MKSFIVIFKLSNYKTKPINAMTNRSNSIKFGIFDPFLILTKTSKANM